MERHRKAVGTVGQVTRRSVLAAAAGASTVALAGCGLLDDQIERSASPATVDSDTRERTQFEHDGTSEMSLSRTVEVGGESRELRLTNYLASFRKTVPAADGGVASVQLFTTPSVQVAGQEANPFAKFDVQQLLHEIASRAGQEGLEDVREVGTRTVRILGAERTATRHEATAKRQGQEIVLRLPVVRLTHEDDILGLFGAYPRLLEETVGVYEAAEGVVHPVDGE